ncbi:MAG: radical SAM protein [Deltaproteobacteria bacterium]|nr:radical SAM protein [Deltaproteobacteria bacterium]MBW2128016.1 radical SAM protein [Deltaproteobacteria bacterium]
MGKQLCFEQGPIRPPNEARSLLIRVTRNCPWNQCLFCPVYKKKKFSLRSVQEIKEDIQAARDIADDIKALSWRLGSSGRVDEEVVSRIFGDPNLGDHYRSIAAWLYYGTGSCFLQDADNLIMKTDDLVEVLVFLREKFPEITRVTTYSRSRTIHRKSLDELIRLREAGLDRVHVGMESGYDPVLKFVRKGVSADRHIDAGRKVMESGLELSEYVMPGLGGQDMWREHAVESARVLNQINPHFIRLRSLRVPERVPLFEKLKSGEFKMQTDDMLAEEIRVFIEHLDGITSMVTSDHIMNLLEEVTGKLPQDKEKMLDVIRRYQELPDRERLIYRVGRRGGAYRSTDDLNRDPLTYKKIENLVSELESKGGREAVEEYIRDMVDQYI